LLLVVGVVVVGAAAEVLAVTEQEVDLVYHQHKHILL
jgi:hypothetical protein